MRVECGWSFIKVLLEATLKRTYFAEVQHNGGNATERYGVVISIKVNVLFQNKEGMASNGSEIPVSKLLRQEIGISDVQEGRKSKDEYRKQKVPNSYYFFKFSFQIIIDKKGV